MTFGQIIKKLRREADYTQETLADLLAISPQAVSRWECDQAMPDIALLPRIANLFGVSADYLLGIDFESRERRITEIRERASKVLSDGNRSEAIHILREGLLNYPNALPLMASLSDALFLEGQFDESFSIAEWVMDHAVNMDLHVQALFTACCILDRRGQHDQAVKLAKTVPEGNQHDILKHLLIGSERIRELRHDSLINCMTFLSDLLFLANSKRDDGKPEYTPDEKRRLYETVLAGFSLFYEKGDLFFGAQFAAQANRDLACLDMEEGREDDATAHLSDCVTWGLSFADYDPEAPHTSLAFRGESDGGYVKESPDDNYRHEIDTWLRDTDFLPLRRRDDFAELLQRLKNDH
ncbi:MAG: helix-turn-helix domain-containing protein [Clostridiales bacterium]|nr:helix-turn-helix domain-containing protein [Clostridiales bacterium]